MHLSISPSKLSANGEFTLLAFSQTWLRYTKAVFYTALVYLHVFFISDYVLSLRANLIFNGCLIIFGKIYFSLSSEGIIVEQPGSSLWRDIASNTHFVVQIPHPMHLFGSTTEAPQLRQREVSAFTCSSVSVCDKSRNERACASSAFSGLCLSVLS